MRVFVTGATGTVGRQVLRALQGGDFEIVAGLRTPETASAELKKAAKLVRLDYEDEGLDPATFEGADALFFMTPLIERQVARSARVLRAAREAGVKHVVRLSSRSAGWDQSSELRAWHRETEALVRDSGCDWTILRPCSFFQNFATFQRESIRRMSAILLPQGDGMIPYVDAADIGDAVARCLSEPASHQGQSYVLTGARAYGPKGIAAEIGRVIGRPVMYIEVDPEQVQHTMLQAGQPQWLVEAGLAVFAHAKSGQEASVDPTLGRLLGRAPGSLSEFVERSRAVWL
jgi:uncharacterized protein YbjT (DUF2867 family)